MTIKGQIETLSRQTTIHYDTLLIETKC